MKESRQYSTEFKQSAVRLVTEQHRLVADVARRLVGHLTCSLPLLRQRWPSSNRPPRTCSTPA